MLIMARPDPYDFKLLDSDEEDFDFNTAENILQSKYRVFADTEGDPILELGAVLVDVSKTEVVAAYCKYALPIDKWWLSQSARYAQIHVHGIDTSIIEQHPHSFQSEETLIDDFVSWCKEKVPKIESIYFNHPTHTEKYIAKRLDCPCLDVTLPPWVERSRLQSHMQAREMKMKAVPIADVFCWTKMIHRCYPMESKYTWPYLTPRDKAKADHRFHCAAYDAWEILQYYHDNRYSPKVTRK